MDWVVCLYKKCKQLISLIFLQQIETVKRTQDYKKSQILKMKHFDVFWHYENEFETRIDAWAKDFEISEPESSNKVFFFPFVAVQILWKHKI